MFGAKKYFCLATLPSFNIAFISVGDRSESNFELAL
jgi:hypothetical protein